MSRCIQKCDLLTTDFNNIGTNVLCNTAGFSGCNTCLTDSIKDRCLTMVNVTHNADNRWSWLKIFFIFFLFLQHLFDNIHNNFMFTENIIFKCDFFCLIICDV